MAKFKIRGEGGLLAKIGRRNGLILCAVLLIGAAVVLNYVFFYGDDGKVDYGSGNMGEADGALNETTDGKDAYFASASLSREQARDEALAVLQTILAEETATEETKAQALADISRIASEIEKEAAVEALVIAKGFEDCIAVLNGDSASIVVKCEGEVQAGQVAQISEIVYEQAGILPANVKIVCK
ncbi:MAG: SpoIIIAH-like family protein [Clostridia bacterium]|nr:SpoIIIAH-like family protein [Clostridia bacterium]MBO5755408.1 SpoIIIAH-like family protein [Clostridia bacterium]